MKKPSKFDIEKFFLRDAAEIVAAREKALLIHKTVDIDTAGNEVEVAVRRFFEKRLPRNYYIGHGHIVDSSLEASPQFDVLITDYGKTPILFEAEDGTGYFPFESVYAIGEIKATYYKRKSYVQSFAEKISTLKSSLSREKVDPTFLDVGGQGIEVEFIPTTDFPYKNPLLSFLLFVNSGDFEPDHLIKLFDKTRELQPPNIICLLDKGIFIQTRLVQEDGRGSIDYHLYPEFSNLIEKKFSWGFIPFGSPENRIASQLGFLYYSILAHLGQTVLKPPRLLDYLRAMFFAKGSEVKII